MLAAVIAKMNTQKKNLGLGTLDFFFFFWTISNARIEGPGEGQPT